MSSGIKTGTGVNGIHVGTCGIYSGVCGKDG